MILILCCVIGCTTTVTPPHVQPASASFDATGNQTQLEQIKAVLATNGAPIVATSNGPFVLSTNTVVKAGSTNEPDSGLLGFIDGQALLKPHAVARYNGLIEQYGKAWSPAVKPWDGVTAFGENFLMDKQHLFYFATTNKWRKEGKAIVK